jgi:hypothetical protein
MLVSKFKPRPLPAGTKVNVIGSIFKGQTAVLEILQGEIWPYLYWVTLQNSSKALLLGTEVEEIRCSDSSFPFTS